MVKKLFPILFINLIFILNNSYALENSKDVVIVHDNEFQTWENGRKYALIIGISKYALKNIPDLKYAVNDAKAVAEFLGKESILKYDEVTLLSDENATRINILRSLTDISKKIGPKDTFFMYYSGHGMEEYLIPFDGNKEYLEDTSVRWSVDIYKKINKMEAKQKILIIDSCHSGSLTESNTIAMKGAAEEQNIDEKLLAQMGQGLFVITSSRVDEISWENDKNKHGYFTYYLLEGLKGFADKRGQQLSGNEDGYVTAEELYDYVSYKTNENVMLDYNKFQHPRKSFNGEGMIFLSKSAQPQKNYLPVNPVIDNREGYKGIQEETNSKKSNDNSSAPPAKNYFTSLPDKKSSISMEYLNLYRDISYKNSGEKISSNYKIKFLKFEYGFAKLFSIYLKTGAVQLTLYEKYGEASFAYEGGAKIDLLSSNIVNFDIRTEYLNFENTLNEIKRKTIWREFRTGTAITFNKYKEFSPYISIYKLNISGKVNSKNEQTENSIGNSKEGNFKQDFFIGIKSIIGKSLFIEAELRSPENLKKTNGVSIGIGQMF
ncbi:caspase family protein [Candidatus Desantisbacteria bacterium]|nr:caspase family protein [Candidatus Desantisbacteria bacterium]